VTRKPWWMFGFITLTAFTVVALRYKFNRIFLTLEYQLLGLLLLAGGFFLILNKKWTARFKPAYYLVFLPMWLMPALRCRFKIPYIFCHLCPSRCMWGEYRNTFIPFYLLLNVDNRYWCWNLCPLGQIQEAVPRRKTMRIPRVLTHVRYGVLAFTLYVIYMNLSYTYHAHYTFSLFSLTLLAVMVTASLFTHRPFCTTLCPIGAFSDIVLKIRKHAKI
jgi:polyferredoxin